jgi:hypothetical protein
MFEKSRLNTAVLEFGIGKITENAPKDVGCSPAASIRCCQNYDDAT